MSKKNCPICKLAEQEATEHGTSDTFTIACSRCGTYGISGSAGAVLERKPGNAKLSAYLRDRSEGGNPVYLNTRNLEEISSSTPDYRVAEKQLRLLKAIEGKSNYPGATVYLNSQFDYPLAWAASADEFGYHMRTLHERSLIEIIDPDPYTLDRGSYKLKIRADGWDYLENKGKVQFESNQVFVAMSFSDSMRSAWVNGIKIAVKSAGYDPCRVDERPHIDRIDAKIITEIKNSKFIVADVTEQKAGVYFEAGFALGQGKSVFWCVRSDELEKVHFDTRQFNHVVWKDETELVEKLSSLIIAVAGRGTAT